MIFKQNVHLTIGLSELPLVNVGDRQFRELCLSAPRAGLKWHKICGRILEVCNVGGDWLTLAVSITSPGTQIVACIEKRGGVVNAVHAYDPYDLTPGVEGRVSYVYFENADEVITIHGFVYGQRYPGEVSVDDIWQTNPPPGDPQVEAEFAFLNHRTVKFRDAEDDNVWVGEFTGRLQLPEWTLDGTLEGAVPGEVTSEGQADRSVDNVARILKQEIDHIALNNTVTCDSVQAMPTASIQMTGSVNVESLPQTLPTTLDVQAVTTAINTKVAQRTDVQGVASAINGKIDALTDAIKAGFSQVEASIAGDPLRITVYALMDGPDGVGLILKRAQVPGEPDIQRFLYSADVSHDDDRDEVVVEGSYFSLDTNSSWYRLYASKLRLDIVVQYDDDLRQGVVYIDLSNVIDQVVAHAQYQAQYTATLDDGATCTMVMAWSSDGVSLEVNDLILTVPDPS